MAGSTMLRSSVLAELEQAEGKTAVLSQEHVRNWIHFLRREQSNLPVYELVEALTAADFLVDKVAVTHINTELARRILDESSTPTQRQQIIEQLPHANLVEAVLKSALSRASILSLIPLLPNHLHPSALTAYAPSITRCRSLKLPHNEYHPESSLSAVTAAATFTSLTCLELFHSKAIKLVGPSDGISPLPADLQLPDTCLFNENNPRRFWDCMRDSCIMAQVDELAAKLVHRARALRGLQSLNLSCTVVGCAVTEALASSFADGCWPLLTSFSAQDCSPDLNPLPAAELHLKSAFEYSKILHGSPRSDPEQSVTMQSCPLVPPALITIMCEGYSHQLNHPELYRCNKFTLQAVLSNGSLKTLHMYECNLTVKSTKTVAALIASSPHLETVHACQSVMVFIREPLLEGLVAQLDSESRASGSVEPTEATCASDDATASPSKRLRSSAHHRSLKHLHVLGHEYSESLDFEAVMQSCSSLEHSKLSQGELAAGPPAEQLQQAQDRSSSLLQKDEDDQELKRSRFKLTDEVLESLCSLSHLKSLGLNLFNLTEQAGCAIAKAVTPNLDKIIMHLDHESDSPVGEQQFMKQLAPSLALATALTLLELPRAVPHDCACEALLPALSPLTGLKRLRLASIGDEWSPEDPFLPKSLQALAKAVLQMPHIMQLELPMLSACDRASMEALMSAAAQCVHLESLELVACTNIEATNTIAPALQSMSQLRHLRLEHCRFGEPPANGPDIGMVLGALKSLESLVLKTTWIPDSLAHSLHASVSTLTGLLALDIRCPPTSDLRYASYLAISMHCLTNLVILQIQSRTVTIEALVNSLPQLTCLEGLFLTLPHQLTYDTVHPLLKSMKNLPLSTLSLDYLAQCQTALQIAHVAYTLRELLFLRHVVVTAYVPDRSHHSAVKEGWEIVVGKLRCWFFSLVH